MFGASGCASASKKRQQAISVGIYQVNESLKKGRVDLAQKYSDQLVRVVAPPKKKPEIKAVEVKTTDGSTNKYIVLPQAYDGTPALTIGTKAFEEVVAKSPELKKQLVQEEKDVKSFEKVVDDSMRSTEKEIEKERKASWFSWLWGIFSFLGIGGIIGIIVLCALFPAAIPIVTSIFGSVIAIANRILTAIAKLWRKDSS